jgi:hypothetical protein
MCADCIELADGLRDSSSERNAVSGRGTAEVDDGDDDGDEDGNDGLSCVSCAHETRSSTHAVRATVDA